ncbi:MAG: phosphonate metabolism transcriptional regulator PhnF [Paracoccaceae bacterium]
MPRTALWTAIAKALTDDIAAARYGPGDKLPTEAELAARFGVNRHTVRRALADLAARDMVHARRGAGVFVTQRPADYPLGRRVRFNRSLRALGKVPGRQIDRLETRSADAAEAGALALAPGAPVHVCEGVSLSDGQPVALFRSVFPAARFPGLPARLRALGSVSQALAAEGAEDHIRHATRISAELADATQALKLHLREGAPLLHTVALNVDPQGRPVEHGDTWFSGDRITLTVDGISDSSETA